MKNSRRVLLSILVVLALLMAFWHSEAALRLASGVALFLFGMQCLEEGLKNLAGGKLEQWLEKSTATRFKGFMFGVGGTMLLQSTTLMSMLTIAFISTGLIQLAGGISILLGINLGTSGGIWLLAAAGQNISLSPLAMPLLVFGVLFGFSGAKGKAIGRIILGIAFIFMGIEQMKSGFSGLGAGLDFTGQIAKGYFGQLVFVVTGMLLTAMLMSSHATLMLVLAALSAGQLELWQGMSIAMGGSMGSSVNVAIMGWLGGNPSGRRLALVHTLFNVATGVVCFFALSLLLWLVAWLLQPLGAGDNQLLQLALFLTIFNLLGVAMFWPWQGRLEQLLLRWLPDPVEPAVLISEQPTQLYPQELEPAATRARYLSESALASVDTAARAVAQELQHLGRLSLEVICYALYQPVSQLRAQRVDEERLNAPPDNYHWLDADTLYQRHIKGVYSDLLGFMSSFNQEMDEDHQRFWLTSQVIALQLVDAVKDAKHLQKNLGRFLRDDRSYVHNHYLDLRRHLLWVLRQIREVSSMQAADDEVWASRLDWVDVQAAKFDAEFRQRIFTEVRNQQLDNQQASSLINDLGYSSRITQSLRNVLQLGITGDSELLRELRHLASGEGEPLLQIDMRA